MNMTYAEAERALPGRRLRLSRDHIPPSSIGPGQNSACLAGMCLRMSENILCFTPCILSPLPTNQTVIFGTAGQKPSSGFFNSTKKGQHFWAELDFDTWNWHWKYGKIISMQKACALSVWPKLGTEGLDVFPCSGIGDILGNLTP